MLWAVLALAVASSGSSTPALLLPPPMLEPLIREPLPTEGINLTNFSLLMQESSVTWIDLSTGNVNVKIEIDRSPGGPITINRSGKILPPQLTVLRGLAESVRVSGMVSEECKQAELRDRNAGKVHIRTPTYDGAVEFGMFYLGQNYFTAIDGCTSRQLKSLVSTAS